MSLSTHGHAHHTHRGSLADIAAGSTPVLGSIAAVLAASLAIVAYTPSALVLPAVALVATLFAIVAGVTAWAASPRLRPAALTSAGIFALVAMGACILGDPDQVALLIK